MNTAVRRGLVVVLLVFGVACGSSGPTSPSGTSQPPTPQSPPRPQPPISFPPLSGPSSTFIFDTDLTYQLRSANPNFVFANPADYTRNSRFIVYENGALVLQYPPSSYGDGKFPGQYREANGILMFLFEFQGRRADEPWDDATGILQGNSLKVQYEESMQHADFEDAVYVLVR